LLKQKCKLVATARTESALKQLSDEYPDQVQIVAGDMADMATGPKAVQAATSKFGKLDGVVINHGLLEPIKRIADSDANEWRKAYDVSFFSAVAIVRAAIPALRQSKGKVIFVSSGAATSAYSTWGAYGSAKAAMNHLSLTLSTEEPEITSVSIRPGTVDTAMQTDIREKHNKAMDKHDVEKFAGLPHNGGLLRPDQPGDVIAKLVLSAPHDLSGKFLSWNDQQLAAFQK
jgi:NAD(P)-dependent dehydrogenase (short-subunit alcohol dehydrogenase family)